MGIFNSINSFQKMYSYNAEFLGVDTERHYVIYPKLHGTNASVLIGTDGSVQARSKNRVISEDADNHGFWKFMDEQRDNFSYHFRDSYS